jgi:hypothetical protein
VEHKPLTKQTSEWEEFDAFRIQEDIPVRWLRRNVRDGKLLCCVAEEPPGWHLSISFRDHKGKLSRYPSWDEIMHARDQLLPADVEFVMWLPKEGEYVAMHDTTFHLHEHPERRQ